MTEPAVRFSRLPVDGPVTQPFGDMFSNYPHRGVDFGVVVGTPVSAPAGGECVEFLNTYTQWNGETVRAFGIGVCLRHDDGWCSLYAHLSRADVKVGQVVRAGDQLGLSGNTGVSTGPHLHWQLSDTPSFPTDIGRSRDPLKFMYTEAQLTTEERALIAVAWGEYERMKDSYAALVHAGLIPDEELIDVDDLNSAVVKRGRIMELVATAPNAAYAVIK